MGAERSPPTFAKFEKFEAGLDQSKQQLDSLTSDFQSVLRPAAPAPAAPKPYRLSGRPVGRNERCPCGSGKKHKNCCLPIARAKGSRVVVAKVRVNKDGSREIVGDNGAVVPIGEAGLMAPELAQGSSHEKAAGEPSAAGG